MALLMVEEQQASLCPVAGSDPSPFPGLLSRCFGPCAARIQIPAKLHPTQAPRRPAETRGDREAYPRFPTRRATTNWPVASLIPSERHPRAAHHQLECCRSSRCFRGILRAGAAGPPSPEMHPPPTTSRTWAATPRITTFSRMTRQLFVLATTSRLKAIAWAWSFPPSCFGLESGPGGGERVP